MKTTEENCYFMIVQLILVPCCSRHAIYECRSLVESLAKQGSMRELDLDVTRGIVLKRFRDRPSEGLLMEGPFCLHNTY